MSSFIEKELENTGSNNLNRYENKINNLIANLVKSTNETDKRKLMKEINKAKRDKTYYMLSNYFKTFLVYVFIVLLFTVNFIAVAISMSCSRGESITKRLFTALYAFFFSVIYIFLNYRYYRLTVKRDTTSCNICPNNPFAL